MTRIILSERKVVNDADSFIAFFPEGLYNKPKGDYYE